MKTTNFNLKRSSILTNALKQCEVCDKVTMIKFRENVISSDIEAR